MLIFIKFVLIDLYISLINNTINSLVFIGNQDKLKTLLYYFHSVFKDSIIILNQLFQLKIFILIDHFQANL